MEVDYEENLCENQFFVKIKNHPVYEQIIEKQWILMVPRQGALNAKSLSSDVFMMAHVMIPNDDLPTTHFTNLNENQITLLGRKLNLIDKNSILEANILFEEIYYSKDLSKLKIFCIDIPLNNDNLDQNSKIVKISSTVKNLNEAVDLLAHSTTNKAMFKKFDTAIASCLRTLKQDVGNVDHIKEKVQKLFKYCLDLVMYNRKLRVKCKNDSFLLTNIKLSIEFYIMDKIYAPLFDLIAVSSAEQNSSINKLIKKLSAIKYEDLGISSSLNEVIKGMKIEFSRINDYHTSLDKLNCLKNTVDFLHKSSKVSKEVTMDDLLPILIYLIVKSELNHWIPTLLFIKDFNLAQILDENLLGSHSFLCTTLEAVILYIQSDCIVIKDQLDQLLVEDSNCIKSKQDYIYCLFYNAINNRDLELHRLITSNYLNLINKSNMPSLDEEIVCHPLCACSECRGRTVEMQPNISLKSQEGLTMLHVAAKAGSSKVISMLINLHADVDEVDDSKWTALHFAASRGHQNVLFLLLHGQASINAKTIDSQTALHLASKFGHGGCVKALLYFAEHVRVSINIDAQDHLGNTSLHYAAQWGFFDILDSLLEYKAQVDVMNRLKVTAKDLAHNSQITEALESAALQLEETPHGNNFVFISNEDLQDNVPESASDSKLQEIHLLNKVFAAIKVNDLKLVCHYLEIHSNIVPEMAAEAEEENSDGCHPLCTCNNCSLIVKSPVPAIEQTKSKPFNINAKDGDGRTALHMACKHNNVELIKILLDNGAKINMKTSSGETSLHIACKYRKFNAIKTLLTLSQVDIIDLKDNNGESVLFHAVKTENLPLVNLLLLHECSTKLRNLNGELAIEIAKKNFFLAVVKVLEKYHQ